MPKRHFSCIFRLPTRARALYAHVSRFRAHKHLCALMHIRIARKPVFSPLRRFIRCASHTLENIAVFPLSPILCPHERIYAPTHACIPPIPFTIQFRFALQHSTQRSPQYVSALTNLRSSATTKFRQSPSPHQLRATHGNPLPSTEDVSGLTCTRTRVYALTKAHQPALRCDRFQTRQPTLPLHQKAPLRRLRDCPQICSFCKTFIFRTPSRGYTC